VRRQSEASTALFKHDARLVNFYASRSAESGVDASLCHRTPKCFRADGLFENESSE
jgi:hypothetical protein